LTYFKLLVLLNRTYRDVGSNRNDVDNEIPKNISTLIRNDADIEFHRNDVDIEIPQKFVVVDKLKELKDCNKSVTSECKEPVCSHIFDGAEEIGHMENVQESFEIILNTFSSDRFQTVKGQFEQQANLVMGNIFEKGKEVCGRPKLITN